MYSKYIYIYQSLHFSGNYVPITRRNNFIYATRGTCYSLWMTVWYAYQCISVDDCLVSIPVHLCGWLTGMHTSASLWMTVWYAYSASLWMTVWYAVCIQCISVDDFWYAVCIQCISVDDCLVCIPVHLCGCLVCIPVHLCGCLVCIPVHLYGWLVCTLVHLCGWLSGMHTIASLWMTVC
jgi:hypothetical protein